ncbi:MAG: tRNA lysidine(34) synthetase TilS [Ruminococcaceae bacterium]|nr:tRNA lysidine(34) synthetase TilS [Oscillospiraceae bacterium]
MVDWFCKWVTEQELICPGDRVAVALSGGADSVCLLYLCHKLRERMSFSLSAAHVNHGLREEAEAEAAFCRELCEQWHIPFFEKKGCARQPGMSTEAAGRALRYAFFDSLEQDKIALAHHKNDQAETVLMHLLRGCGGEGLSGMAMKRGKYIRPLLQVSRQEIEDFCQKCGLQFCTDQSNFSTEYTRNRLRLEVIPLLETINPETVDALCRTAHLLEDDVKQLEEDVTEKWVFKPYEDGFFCNRKEFFRLSPSLQRRMIRKCWQALTGEKADLWLEPVNRALTLFSQGKTGKKVCLGKDIWAENSYEELLIGRESEVLSFCLPLSVGERVQIPNTDLVFTAYIGSSQTEDDWIFDYNLIKSGINIRSRKNGDVFCLNGKHQKLKKLFIDRKIPRRIRNRAVVAESNGTVIAVTGLGVAKEFRGKGDNCLIVTQERMSTNEFGSNGGKNTDY